MSIAGIFGRLGVSVPKYVTIDGQIVFDAVGTGGGGYTTPNYGAVTPVPRHTFHGGVDEPTDPGSDGTRWWDDAGKLQRHIDAMNAAFPGFVYLEPEDGLPPTWGGEINTGYGKYRIGVTLRSDESLPSVYYLGNAKLGMQRGRWWTPSPHLYLNGNLCIADQSDWDSAEHTAATAVAWAAHWFAAYTVWKLSGGNRWPTPGAEAVAA